MNWGQVVALGVSLVAAAIAAGWLEYGWRWRVKKLQAHADLARSLPQMSRGRRFLELFLDGEVMRHLQVHVVGKARRLWRGSQVATAVSLSTGLLGVAAGIATFSDDRGDIPIAIRVVAIGAPIISISMVFLSRYLTKLARDEVSRLENDLDQMLVEVSAAEVERLEADLERKKAQLAELVTEARQHVTDPESPGEPGPD